MYGTYTRTHVTTCYRFGKKLLSPTETVFTSVEVKKIYEKKYFYFQLNGFVRKKAFCS